MAHHGMKILEQNSTGCGSVETGKYFVSEAAFSPDLFDHFRYEVGSVHSSVRHLLQRQEQQVTAFKCFRSAVDAKNE